MRRWLVIFLLGLLPLQFTWAAAAGYCVHESGSAVKHFGHHVHVHKNAKTPDDARKDASGKTFADADCPFCHLSAPPLIPELTACAAIQGHGAVAAVDPPAPPSARADTPERPNWPLAA